MHTLLFTLLLIFSANVSAYTGNQLLEYRDGNTAEQMFSLGYIVGTTNMAAMENPFPVCIPDAVNNRQVSDAVLKYLKETPEQRHMDAAFLVYVALHEAFPCPIDNK